MALPKPNQLRYAQCQIPLDVEGAIQTFVDEFYADMSAIDLELDDFAANNVPAILAAERAVAEQIDQLLQGAPVEQLASLQALQDNLYLANPKLDEDDPAIVSLDERKLGAVGMALINGKMFALTAGTEMETFRQVWFAVGGDYQAFLALGDGIADTTGGDFTLLQYVPGKKEFPFVNKKWSVLDTQRTNVRLSKYVQPLIWTDSVGTGTSMYNKLKAIGYSDINVARILSGRQPRDGADTITAQLQSSVAQMTYLSSLYNLPVDDPKRSPKWSNEVKYVEGALSSYLQFRQEINLSAHTFNSDLWERVKASLTATDLKEIFENRPEIQNMTVPTDANTIGNLLNAASALQPGSTAINSYMVKLPQPFSTAEYEARILSVGASLLQTLTAESNPASGKLQSTLEELKGAAVSIADITTPPILTLNDMQAFLGDPAQTVGGLVSSVNSSIKSAADPNKALDAIAASVVGSAAIASLAAVLPVVGLLVPAALAVATTTLGLPTAESFMTVLFRRIKWDQNFVTCSKVTGSTTSSQATNQPISATTSTYPSANTVQDKFTKFGPALNNNIQTKPGGSPSATDLYGVNGKELLTNPKNLGKSGENLNNLPNSGQARRNVVVNQGAQPSTVKSQFSYQCTPSFHNGFLDEISNLFGKVTQEIIVICEALKRALFLIQNIVDSLIAKAQVILDQVLGILERLLTLNLNLGAALGFDTSLIKCSWSVNLVGKIDFFGVLLKALNDFFNNNALIQGFRKGLKAIQDIINKAICVPVRLLELFLGGANALLGLIGCSLKDIQLPTAILDLLKALLFTFDLRTLVLRSGYNAFYGLAANFSKGSQAFNGLSQFASLCQSVTMADAVGTLENASLLAGLAAPAKVADQISKQADILTKKTLTVPLVGSAV